MQRKTIDKIQLLAKIGLVLSKIVFVLSIIGVAVCVVALILLAVRGNYITNVIKDVSFPSLGQAYAELTTSTVIIAGEIFTSKTAKDFFKYELSVGTPLDFTVADKMKSFGIKVIGIPAVAVIVSWIIHSIFSLYYYVEDIDFCSALSVGLGIAILVTSVICRYGAEVKQEKEKKDNNDNILGE